MIRAASARRLGVAVLPAAALFFLAFPVLCGLAAALLVPDLASKQRQEMVGRFA